MITDVDLSQYKITHSVERGFIYMIVRHAYDERVIEYVFNLVLGYDSNWMRHEVLKDFMVVLISNKHLKNQDLISKILNSDCFEYWLQYNFLDRGKPKGYNLIDKLYSLHNSNKNIFHCLPKTKYYQEYSQIIMQQTCI